MPRNSAAGEAIRLLRSAAQTLGTRDPVEAFRPVLEETLSLPPGHPAYLGHRTLEPRFSETSAGDLSFQLSAAPPGSSPADQVDSATRVVRDLVSDNFGNEAVHWFDGRSEPFRSRTPRTRHSEAWIASGFDRDGMMESMVNYEWGSDLVDALPGPLFQIAQTAMQTLPGLRPASSAIRCGRSSGSQQISFEVERALALSDLKVLMDRLGLGARHASLMSVTAFVLGARFTLPPDTALLTFRPTRSGVEMRLDVDLDAIPDTPSQFMSLLRLQMMERPTGLRALDRWLSAMTPDGYDGPGSLSVMSVRVRPDMPARLALYLQPTALSPPDPGAESGVVRTDDVARAPVIASSSRTAGAWR